MFILTMQTMQKKQFSGWTLYYVCPVETLKRGGAWCVWGCIQNTMRETIVKRVAMLQKSPDDED